MLRGRLHDIERIAIEALYRPTAGGAGSGITQLTADVIAGPGSGSQIATIIGARSGIQVGSDVQAFGGGAGGIIGVTNATTPPSAQPAGGIALYSTTAGGLTGLVQAGQAYAFAPFVTTPFVGQLPAAAGTGATLKVSAQDSPTGQGGNLTLAGGVGASVSQNGSASMTVGGTTMLSLSPNGLLLGAMPVPLVNGTNTLTPSQYQFPLLRFTGTLTASTTIVFPNVQAVWVLDFSQLTGTGNAITLQSGTATALFVVGAPTNTGTLLVISTTGSNGIATS
jgi:hypothetical protein